MSDRITSVTSRRTARLAFAVLLGCVASASRRKDDPKMNEQISLYGWVRGGASITLARIEQVTTRAAAPSQEAVVIDVRIEHVLFGPKVKPSYHYELLRPTSEVARLKFPDPIWARVTLRSGTDILLVMPVAQSTPTPEYVEDAASDDPVLRAIRAVLDAEQPGQPTHERFARYVRWVTGGTPVERLFGAEALAKDPLPEVDAKGEAARALAARFTSDGSLYIRLSVGAWVWDHVLARSSAAGKAAVLDATLHGLTDHSEDIRRFCRERLAAADEALLKLPGMVSPPGALAALQQQIGQDGDPQTRAGLERWIKLLQASPHEGPRPQRE